VVLLLAAVTGSHAQGLTGTLIGSVKDQQGGAIRGAEAIVSSRALIGGPQRQATNDKGQFRFAALPPGSYALEIRFDGFGVRQEDGIVIGGGMTIAREVELSPADVEHMVVVDGGASRIDARDPGFSTRFGPQDLGAIPTRRSSMFDALRNVPGVSATSPSSGTATTISAFGSGTNENLFLIDGTNTTCPCNGVARSEPGVDFIQEIQVQAVGASAEFGNVQGAVVNVITRQGSARFLFDSSYYAQPRRLTSQPVRLRYDGGRRESGYARARYRDYTANLGGPAIRDRLWFFGGYQYLRDHDSQPGTDPGRPKTYEQNKTFGRLTWRLAPGWQLNQSFHYEYWVSPEQPRIDRPIETTTRATGKVPATTFGHLTHTASARTVWDVRVGRFAYRQKTLPSTGRTDAVSRLDALTNLLSGGPMTFSGLSLFRTTGKATLNHYRTSLWRADHAFKVGVQVERGEHHSPVVIPTGVRYTDRNGPFSATFGDPSNTGGVFLTTGVFATDAITVNDRLTVNAGLRFDRSRAISQDLPGVDLEGRTTPAVISGAGTLYSWNIFSPRLGVSMKLDESGRTMLRASYGRFSQGVFTGELAAFHPGASPIVTKAWVPAAGDYTRVTTVVDRNLLQIDSNIRAPRTDEYGIGVDREIGSRLQIATAYVRKSAAHFIGWEDVGGVYSAARTRGLADGRTLLVYERLNDAADQRFRLTNPPDYSMTYNGLVVALEKRRSSGWHAFASYTRSKVTGLQAGSGGIATAPQVSTVSPPPGPYGLTFGRDPNELTNARGRLLNDRPHMLRAMGSVDVPKTGFTVAANLQHITGKPWAASAQVSLPQNPSQRILLEPRGTRRLSAQTLLDVRLARPVGIGRAVRMDLLLDVLNLLNEDAEESIVSDTQVTELARVNPTFGQPNAFVDPRRVMLGIRFNLGR
jgi:hypothetical protein